MTSGQEAEATKSLDELFNGNGGGGELFVNGAPCGDVNSAMAELTGLDKDDAGFFLSDLKAVLDLLHLYNDPLQAKAEKTHARMHISIDGNGYQPGQTTTSYTK